MDKNRWATKEFKVVGSHNIRVETEFLGSDYHDPSCAPVVKPSDTGHLVLLRIEPKRASLPAFSVRWDQSEDSVNVDLDGEDEEKRKFATRQPGYRGHKTDRVGDNPRTYTLDIETPVAGHVFKGTLTLNVDLGLLLKGSLNFSAGFQKKLGDER